MSNSDPQEYPFPDDEIKARWHNRERPVCGGYTGLEWNQHGTRDVAFGCSHGTQGCGWRIHIGTTDSFNVMFMAEFDYADELHHRYAWDHLDRQASTD